MVSNSWIYLVYYTQFYWNVNFFSSTLDSSGSTPICGASISEKFNDLHFQIEPLYWFLPQHWLQHNSYGYHKRWDHFLNKAWWNFHMPFHSQKRLKLIVGYIPPQLYEGYYLWNQNQASLSISRWHASWYGGLNPGNKLIFWGKMKNGIHSCEWLDK